MAMHTRDTSWKPEQFYQESGIVPLRAYYIMFLTGLVVAMLTTPVIMLLAGLFMAIGVIGIIILAVLAIPALIASFFICLVHGGVVHLSVLGAADLCSVRNKHTKRIVAAMTLLCAFYFFVHAMFWLITRSDWNQYFPLLNPLALLRALRTELEFMPTAGTIAVVALLLVYFVPYLIAIFLPYEHDAPYCETCDCFCKLNSQKLKFSHLRPSNWRRGELVGLRNEVIGIPPVTFYKAEFYHCDRCEDSNYLRVWRIHQTPSPKDNKQRDEATRLVYNLLCVRRETKSLFDAAASESPSLE